MENLKYPCLVTNVEVGTDLNKPITVSVNRIVKSEKEYNALMLEIAEAHSPFKKLFTANPPVDYYAEIAEKNGWTRQQAKMVMFPFNYGTRGQISKTLMTRDEPKSVFMIERFWIDYKDGTKSSVIGYESIGFVVSEEEAQLICSKGKTYTQKDCWAILRDTPQFIYEEIKHYDRRYEKG